MICNISPSSDSYEESLSTLRYAKNAKRISNNAIINEILTEDLVRKLQDENENLKRKIFELQNQLEKSLSTPKGDGFSTPNKESLNNFIR